MRARRLPSLPPALAAASGGAAALAEYTDAFEASLPAGDERTPEQWARAIYEGPPRPMYWLVVIGWRLAFLLRLGPLSAPGYVLGWRIEESTAEWVRIAVESPLLSARIVVRRDERTVSVATIVRFTGLPGRALWRCSTPVHHAIVYYLLGHAVADA